MILLVKILVIFVCLSVEHLVEMPAGVHLRWFVRGCEPLQHEMKGAQSFFEPRYTRFQTLWSLGVDGTDLSFSVGFDPLLEAAMVVVCGTAMLTIRNRHESPLSAQDVGVLIWYTAICTCRHLWPRQRNDFPSNWHDDTLVSNCAELHNHRRPPF